jgi:plasmid maintenance system antidote protein VapI
MNYRETQHPLLDSLRAEFNLKDDAALARFLGTTAPEISKIRNRKLNVSGDRVLQVYDATGWDIPKIRSLLA